jgi:two-component system, NtrC family, response regulator HydG
MPKKLKVLVVDDNKEFCRNVKDILELKGHEVTPAHDGFKALERVKQGGFDLVLMDVKMPIMDGVKTFKKIKEIKPKTPVIMISAYAVEELIRDGLRAGVFGFLKKPVDFDMLLGLMEDATRDGTMILVVDDDEDLCSNMENILTDKGYRVAVAYDGETAIQKTRENSFDVMLIDMKLPPVNGLETYLSIRNIRPDVVAIIITGYPKDMSDLVKLALKRGAYICLEKPLDMEGLVSLVQKIEKDKASGTLKKPE